MWAIGECAAPAGRMYGLVAPGYAMAEVVVDALLGGPGAFTGADMSTKLKLLGVDVASFGDAFASTEGALELVFAGRGGRASTRSWSSATTAGGCSAACWSATRRRTACCGRWSSSGIALPDNPEELILPLGRGGVELGLPDEAQVCSCNDVCKAEIVAADGDCDARARRPGPAPRAAPASPW